MNCGRRRYTALVCGGRVYNDYDWINSVLALFGVERVVHGDADGADTGGKLYAIKRGIPHDPYPIRRPTENGFDRNSRMLKEAKPQLIDICIAFPGGNGTADMVRKARRAGVLTVEIPHAS